MSKYRYIWIRNWINKNNSADILDADFVSSYCIEFGVDSFIQPFGANKCPKLSKDLGLMYKKKYLNRTASGIGDGFCYMGFPRWVYSYKIGRRAYEIETD